MAEAISSQREISIHSDRSAGTPISGDKEISEATLKNLASFILDNDYELNYDSQTLRNLKIKPLSCDEIKFGIRLINGHPLITVVENKENKDRSGLIRVTMKRTISIRDLHRFGIASDSGLALGSLEAGASIKIITVSQNAWDALNRYKSQLERRESYRPRPVYVAPVYQRREEHRPLLHRERSCCSDLCSFFSSDKCCDYLLNCWKFISGAACLGITGALTYAVIENSKS